MSDKKDILITDLPQAENLASSDITIVAQESGTKQTSLANVGSVIATSTSYNSLNTTSKSLVGGINELVSGKQNTLTAGTGITISSNTVALSQTVLTGTLTAGNTSIIFTNDAITTSSTIQYFIEPPTNTYDGSIRPLTATVDTGSITLTFAAQQSNIGVKVVIT